MHCFCINMQQTVCSTVYGYLGLLSVIYMQFGEASLYSGQCSSMYENTVKVLKQWKICLNICVFLLFLHKKVTIYSKKPTLNTKKTFSIIIWYQSTFIGIVTLVYWILFVNYLIIFMNILTNHSNIKINI